MPSADAFLDAPDAPTGRMSADEFLDGDEKEPSFAGRMIEQTLKPSAYVTSVIMKSFGYDAPESPGKSLHPETVQAMKLSGDWEDYQKEHTDWKNAVVNGAAKPAAENMQERFASATGQIAKHALEGVGEGYEFKPFPEDASSNVRYLAAWLANKPLQAGASVFSGLQQGAIEAGKQAGSPAAGRDIAMALEVGGIMHPASYGRFESPMVALVNHGVAEGVVGVRESVWNGLKEPTAAEKIRMQKAREALPTDAEKVSYYDTQIENLKGAIERNPQKAEVYQAQIDRLNEAKTALQPVEPKISIDRAVRLENPQIFSEYDASASRMELLRTNIASLREQHAAKAQAEAPHAQEIADLQASLEGKSPRQQKKAQEKIDQLTAERDTWIESRVAEETPEIKELREGLQSLDVNRRDMAEKVSAAYRSARENYPEIETVPPKAESYIPEQKAAPVMKPGEGPWGPIPGFSIADDFKQNAIAAGRTVEQADAEASLVDAHYKAISEQGWTKGTPEEIYQRHIAEIKEGKKPKETELAQEVESPFEHRPSERQIPSDNYSRNLGEYSPVMFRETSANRALELLPHGGVATEVGELHLADTTDMATGQGVNKGVMIAFDTKDLKGQRNRTKPTADLSYSQGFGEYYGKNNTQSAYQKAVSAVRISKDAVMSKVDRAMLSRTIKTLEEKGWTKNETEKYIEYSRPKNLAQGSRGSIKLATDAAKATIKLFKSQNASTLVHELGHHWLDEMMTWAKAADAPEGLIQHSKTVREWLGAKEGDFSGFTRTQHEKFARGFERYLMEGVAPSKELANVFAQFKEWLGAIYQTVQKLRAPISDEVRNVFDHMLAANPEKIAVVPEKKGAAADVQTAPKETPAPITVAKEIPSVAAPSRVAEAEAAVVSETMPPATAAAEAAIAPVAAVEKPLAPGEVGNPNRILSPPHGDLMDKAGNIRLENLTDAADVREGIRQLAAQEENFLDARRGVVSDMEVSGLANAMGVEEQAVNLERMRQLSVEDGIPLAVRIKALRKMLEPAEIAAREAMQKVIDSKGSDDALMEFADARRRFLMITETVSGVTAEWGRAGRAFRDISKEEKGNTAALEELFQRIAGKSKDELRQMANEAKNFDTPAKMGKFLQDSTKPEFLKALTEYRMAAMLFGPRTHVKNFISNMALAINAATENVLASAIGKALGSKERIELNEAIAHWSSMGRGTEEGWTTAKAILRDEDAIAGTHTIENVYQHAIPGTFGKVVRLPFRLLSASDELFKGIASRQSINAEAVKIANEEKLVGEAHTNRVADLVRSPTEKMIANAKEYADYQTLTKKLEGTPLKAQLLINSHFVLKNIVPFFRTNLNSLDYFIKDRTIFGVASREVRDNLMGKNGERMRDLQIARTTLGTAVTGLAVSMVLNNRVTGAGPKDPQERALWLRTHQPYSIRIGDAWYSYEGLQGFSSPFGMAADVAETVMHGVEHQEELEKIILTGVGAISKRLLNMASLQGIADTTQAYSNPDQYFDRWLQNYITSYIPNFVPSAAWVQDPEMREVHDMIDAFKSKIPFYKQGLLPRRDVWGEPIKREGALGSDFASPIFQKSIINDPVDQRLAALKYYPALVGNKINEVKLTEQQQDDYQRIAGRLAKMRLESVVTKPRFASMPQFAQINIIKDIIDDSREEARGQMLKLYPEIIAQAIQQRREAHVR